MYIRQDVYERSLPFLDQKYARWINSDVLEQSLSDYVKSFAEAYESRDNKTIIQASMNDYDGANKLLALPKSAFLDFYNEGGLDDLKKLIELRDLFYSMSKQYCPAWQSEQHGDPIAKEKIIGVIQDILKTKRESYDSDWHGNDTDEEE